MRRNFTVDELLEMKDAGLVASSAAAQVDGADHIEDVGSGFVAGHVVVDISAIEVADNDERYDIILQGSNDDAFASGYVDLAAVAVGASEVVNADADTPTGRIVLPFENEFMGTVYRYLRMYTVVAGTVATGINYTARLAV